MSTGSLVGSTSDIVSSVLPFVLLFGFWIFLMRKVRTGDSGPSVADKLEEIRQELERIRKAIEGSSQYK